MDNNISELLNKVLSNPEMLDKVTSMLPAVSALMGGDKDKKVVETTALPDKQENSGEQDNSQPSPPPQTQNISIEQLIVNENVVSAFKNLIIAINTAQNPQSDTVTQSNPNSLNNSNVPNGNNTIESKLGDLLASLSANKSDDTSNKNDAVSASTLGNILGSLISNTKPNGIANGGEDTAEFQSEDNNGAEKALESLKKFSAITGPEKDERVKLLLALKPFLKDERQGKVDTAVKYMSVAKIINLFGKNGFV